MLWKKTDRFAPFNPPIKSLDKDSTKIVFAEAIEVAVRLVIYHHIYIFNGKKSIPHWRPSPNIQDVVGEGISQYARKARSRGTSVKKDL